MSGVVTQNVGRPSGLVKAVEAGGGAWVEIKSITLSGNGTESFVDGTSDVVLDNTYPIYCFEFVTIHPSADGAGFQINLSEDTGSNYNVTKTSALFQAYHNEANTTVSLEFQSSLSLQQATGVQTIASDIGNDNDQNMSGHLYLFSPADTTFVKHYTATTQTSHGSEYSQMMYSAGYGNTTSAIDAVQFSVSSGNLDTGKIKLFGIKDS